MRTNQLLPIDILRQALDHIQAIGEVATNAQSTAEQAQALSKNNKARLDSLEGCYDWFTALAYAKYVGIDTSLSFCRKLGKAATAVAKPLNITPEKRQDGRYAWVNSYPLEVWDQAARNLGALTP